MASTKPTYTKLGLDSLVDNRGNFKDGGKRVNNFLDQFYDQKKFLTDVGLVDVFQAYLTYDGKKHTFDADTRQVKKEREDFLKSLKEAGKSKKKELKFQVGLKYINILFTIPISWFKKTPSFGGQGSQGSGKTLNRGNQFEQYFYEDAVKVLEGATTGRRFKKIRNESIKSP